MRYSTLAVLAIVVVGCSAVTTPSVTPPDDSLGGTPAADVDEARRFCGWPTDTSIGWSGHATLSDLGLPVTAGDFGGLVIVTAEPITDLPEGYPPQDPPVRWFCAIPDLPAEVGSDFVFGPVPENWDAPGG